jgi:hypothetical protein
MDRTKIPKIILKNLIKTYPQDSESGKISSRIRIQGVRKHWILNLGYATLVHAKYWFNRYQRWFA